MRKHSHYFKDVSHLDEIDVYRVCDLFKIDDPSGATQHALKKILLPGQRGEKGTRQDLQEAVDTLVRRIQMLDEDAGWTEANIMSAGFDQKNKEPQRPRHVCPACGLGHSIGQCNPITPEEAVALGGKPIAAPDEDWMPIDRCQATKIDPEARYDVMFSDLQIIRNVGWQYFEKSVAGAKLYRLHVPEASQ